MQLSVGSVICTLRREKGITQEQLAERVGVSAPAVSKWETGASYPDITLLKPIARCLGTTVDALLDFQKELTQEQLQAIIRECTQLFTSEDFETAQAACEDYLREYPNCLILKYQIAATLSFFLNKADSEESRKQVVKKAIGLLQAAAQSEEAETALNANALLGNLYMRNHEFDKAEAVFKKIPQADLRPEFLLPSLYRLQGREREAMKLDQRNLLNSINHAVLSLSSMAAVAMHQKRMDYALKLAGAQRRLMETFELDDFMKIQNCRLYLHIYAARKDREAALDALNEYAQWLCVLDLDHLRLSDIDYFDQADSEEASVASNFTKADLIKALKNDRELDFIRDSQRYRVALRKLEAEK